MWYSQNFGESDSGKITYLADRFHCLFLSNLHRNACFAYMLFIFRNHFIRKPVYDPRREEMINLTNFPVKHKELKCFIIFFKNIYRIPDVVILNP